MDKKTLEALNNFALALEELVETFEKKAKEEEDFGGLGGVFSKQQDINNTITRIGEKIDNISESNKKMITNQEKILGMTKDIKSSQESKGIFAFGNSEKSKKGVKDGVGSIILIAAGILAIGIAFKLIGSVDFISVIALSIAMPLIAIAFTEVATAIKEHGLGYKDILMTGFAITAMALALTASSWILWYIRPIGLPQFITALAISAIFVVLSYAIAEAVRPLRRMKIKDIIMLPIVFVAMSLALMLSSHILGLSAVVDPSLLWNLILQSVTLSIMAIAMSVPMMLFKMFGLKVKDVAMGGIMLVMVAATMMISSWLINLGTYDNYPSLMWAIGVGAALTVLSLPIIIMGFVAMTGVGLAAIALGSIAAIIVSTTIMIASHILNDGVYENYPGLGWAIGVGATMGVFGLSMVALGFIMLTGIGFIALSLGSSAMLKIANTIVSVSEVLSGGQFDNAGDLAKWAIGVTLLFVAFVPIFLLLGAISMAASFASLLTFGTSPDPFEAGHKAIMQIARTIRDVSFVLGEGDYSGGPTPTWALGVGLAIGAFAPVFQTLSAMNIWSIFGGSKFTADDYANAIVTVSMAIIQAADVFRNAPTRWEGGPTKKWAEGVGLAIGAFAPIFEILTSQGILDSIFGTTVTPEDMGKAIRVIANSIMDAADIFNRDSGSYKGGPTKKWSEGVGQAITSFSEIYEWVFDGINWTPEDIDQANGVIYKIARSILHMAKIFQGTEIEFDPSSGTFKETQGPKPKWGGFPTTKWSDGVTTAIQKFIELYEWVFDGVDWDEDDITEANTVIYKIAKSILHVAEIMAPLGSMTLPAANAAGDLAKNLKSWKKIVQASDDLDSGNLFTTALKIKFLAEGVDKLATALVTLNDALSSLQTNQLDALNSIAGTFISFSVIDEDNFSAIMDIVEDNSESLAKLFGTAKEAIDQTATEDKFSFSNPAKKTAIKSPQEETTKEKTKTLSDVYAMLEVMDSKLAQISKNSSNLSNYVNELRANPEVKIK